MNRTFETVCGKGLIALVLISAACVMMWNLGKAPLQDYDEATYAQVVHEAFLNNDFISFTYNGEPFLKKPPLMFWAMGVSEYVFGETEFAMRLPSVVFGIVLIGVLMLLAYELSKSLLVAGLAGAVALTTSPLVETAREVRMDLLVSLCIMAAIYAYLRGGRVWFMVMGICVGLAVLAKSVIAVFAPIAIISLILFSRRFTIFRDFNFWYAVIASIVIAAPWHLYMWYKHGAAFWQEYIGLEVLERTQHNLFWTVTITNADLWNYVTQFTQPWLWIFFVSIVLLIVVSQKGDVSLQAFVMASSITMISMVAVFAFSATKAPTYLIPLYPFAAVLIALAFGRIFQTRAWWLALTLACGLVVWGGALTVYNALHYNPYYSTMVAIAEDEYVVGKLLAETPSSTSWYVYRNQNLGSIKYYSQRLTAHELEPGDDLLQGSYIVLDSAARPAFAREFNGVPVTTLYEGSHVMLIRRGDL